MLKWFRHGLTWLPPVGWAIGSYWARGSGEEFLAGWLGWALTSSLVIGTFWIGMDVAAFFDLRDDPLPIG